MKLNHSESDFDIYPTLSLIFSHVNRPAVQNKRNYCKPYDWWINLLAVGSDFFNERARKIIKKNKCAIKTMLQ